MYFSSATQHFSADAQSHFDGAGRFIVSFSPVVSRNLYGAPTNLLMDLVAGAENIINSTVCFEKQQHHDYFSFQF